MKDFRKQCNIGMGTYNVWVTIKFENGRLFITGVESPRCNGNCSGSCGQIQDQLNPLDFRTFFKGWDAVKVAKLKKIWKQWHLNDMQAGSPDQILMIEAMREIDNPGNMEYYDWACSTLKAAGIYEDPNYLIEGKPYRYGSAWLSKEVPEDVLQWLYDLPDAVGSHPWCITG